MPQDVQGMMAAMHGLKGKELDLVLHSPGRSLEAAEQLVSYLRSKYERIRAIIPQNAMSAATMLACACDEIVMGKHSAIGPIDPQMTFPTNLGRPSTAPAQAILDEFARAKEEVAKDPKSAPLWVAKIRDYPPGFLVQCETALALATQKVQEWLDKWMFRDDAEKGGAAIANWLSDHKMHRTKPGGRNWPPPGIGAARRTWSYDNQPCPSQGDQPIANSYPRNVSLPVKQVGVPLSDGDFSSDAVRQDDRKSKVTRGKAGSCRFPKSSFLKTLANALSAP